LAENAANKNEKSLDLWIPPVSILLLTKNLLKINKFSAKWFTLRLAPTPSRDFRKWKTKSGRIESWTWKIYYCHFPKITQPTTGDRNRFLKRVQQVSKKQVQALLK
jgi:hypothetical protein